MMQDAVVDIVTNGVFTVLSVAAPPLIIGLSVGILVSVLQTLTSIQEATLAFVPKIVAVLLSLVFFGNYMLTTLKDFLIETLEMIPSLM